MKKIINIILKPDAYFRNLYKEIIIKLNNQGISIINFLIIKPNTNLLEQMYLEGFQWKYDYWLHNTKLFELGPSLALLCELESDIEFNNYTRNIKGNSLPRENNKNSIRFQFNVTDRCINLIHIADDLDKSSRELECIWGLKSKYLYSENVKKISIEKLLEKIKIQLCYEQTTTKNEVLFKLQLRIAQKINYNLSTVIKNQKSNYCLFQLNDMITNFESSYLKISVDKRIKFWEYFLILMNKEMVYYSDYEKYILESEILYHEINC